MWPWCLPCGSARSGSCVIPVLGPSHITQVRNPLAPFKPPPPVSSSLCRRVFSQSTNLSGLFAGPESMNSPSDGERCALDRRQFDSASDGDLA